ncbi:MAG TPA: hypothetical protein VLM91_10960, partial [Candidatus Methylomirabilis sp.]|nr:hypothetical protein [Candidatus Methylomirabilis sp.]
DARDAAAPESRATPARAFRISLIAAASPTTSLRATCPPAPWPPGQGVFVSPGAKVVRKFATTMPLERIAIDIPDR